jgi:bifunctional UDP-N-acetylglucosamine pyrophosphorylase/glucosamine-1-phosphate N-acetyltransferase
MCSSVPKVLHKVAGLAIVDHVIRSVSSIAPANVVVVASEAVMTREYCGCEVVLQSAQNGTADAVMRAIPYIRSEEVIIVCGDLPLLTAEHLEELTNSKADIAFIATELPCRLMRMPYGRVITKDGRFVKIVEYADAADSDKKCGVINTGIYKFKTSLLAEMLRKVEKSEATGEYYLTETLGIAQRLGMTISIVENGDYEAFHGVNTMKDLAIAEGIMQNRIRNTFMDLGVRMLNPESTFLSYDTEMESDVTIEQNVVMGTGVKIRGGAIIKAFSYLEDCEIGANTSVGPFARIRGSSRLERGVTVGNFVEVKGTMLGENSKAKHMAYLGDTYVGSNTNIGAGTIVCNYDGVNKHKTNIGANAFVGSNTTLIAPLNIGSGAIIAAGSVITENVENNSLAIARTAQSVMPNGAEKVWAKKGKHIIK